MQNRDFRDFGIASDRARGGGYQAGIDPFRSVFVIRTHTDTYGAIWGSIWVTGINFRSFRFSEKSVGRKFPKSFRGGPWRAVCAHYTKETWPCISAC